MARLTGLGMALMACAGDTGSSTTSSPQGAAVEHDASTGPHAPGPSTAQGPDGVSSAGMPGIDVPPVTPSEPAAPVPDAGQGGASPVADDCPADPDKTEPGACGCGQPDQDTDGDGAPDCEDGCPMDPDKLEPGDCGCGEPEVEAGATCGVESPASECGPVISPVPDAVRARLDLDPFYEKYVDAGGLPVLGSSEPDDASLLAACALVNDMVKARKDVREALIAARARFAIIGRDEGTAEIPEYGYRDRSQEDIDYINRRARGLGGQVASCGEENILCLPGDRYRNESICVHEFAHTISIYGLYRADRTFEGRLRDTFENARDTGLYANTYALENAQEYWAEGVQNWYDTNDEAIPANGIHNEIDTRVELESYDPTLYELVAELLPDDTTFDDCHRP